MEIHIGKPIDRIHVYLRRSEFSILCDKKVVLQLVEEDYETQIELSFEEVENLIDALKNEVNHYYESQKIE